MYALFYYDLFHIQPSSDKTYESMECNKCVCIYVITQYFQFYINTLASNSTNI